jgi:hypothetical protein
MDILKTGLLEIFTLASFKNQIREIYYWNIQNLLQLDGETQDSNFLGILDMY